MVTLPIAIAALLTLSPYLVAAFFGEQCATWIRSMPTLTRIAAPAILAIPYVVVTWAIGTFRLQWLALYTLLPVALAAMMEWARSSDPDQRSGWREFVLLAGLGLAVDLRWFEAAWPPHLSVFNKILLLDAGIYAFLLVREVEGVGFNLRLSMRDLGIGLREFLVYTPVAVALGLSLGFLHFHPVWPSTFQAAGALLFTFFFIAVPEELFFRGWLQNLLERRMGRIPSLITTAILFGLAHWNKRTVNFNWRYVLLAAIAGVFYGRAWRQERRVGASAITHACVDTVWSLWLR